MRLPILPMRYPSGLDRSRNGRLSPDELVTLPRVNGGSDVVLLRPAALAWEALVAAAKSDGHILKVSHLNNSYRPYADQERIFRARYTPHSIWLPGRRRWQGKWWAKRPGVAAAAVPGTSNHGLGLAVDTGEERDGDPGTESIGPAALAWLIANAHRFGFSAELQSEPWHWRYVAGDLTPREVHEFHKIDESEEDDMLTLIDTTTNEHWVAANGRADKLSKPSAWMADWDGPVRRSANMRHVIATLYEVVD